MDGDTCVDDSFYSILLWLILIIILIVVITLVMFNLIRQYALFQATRDQKWFPIKEECHESQPEKCRDYTEGFTNSYLVIGDRKHKAFTRSEITKISESRTFNIGDLHYINIWKFEQFPGQRIVLYYHGNNDNITYRKYVVDICYKLKLNLLLVDYRGYGDSSALPSSQFLLEDAKTVYKHLRNTYASDEVIIWGESLGGIAAIWTAHKYRCNSLILLSTFADLRTIIAKIEGPEVLKKMLNKFIDTKLMNNGKWIKNVTSPTVILHSLEDDILPYVNAEMNYKAVDVENKKLINIAGVHAHPYFTYQNLHELLEFIHIDDDILNDRGVIAQILETVNNL